MNDFTPPSLHSRTLNVLIDVAGFNNRGDQLMLEACVDQVRAHCPNARIAVPESVWRGGASWCLQHGILPFTGLSNGLKSQAKSFVKRTAERFISRRPVRLHPDQIDLVLVAPGFRYSDVFKSLFPAPAIRAEIRKFRSFRKRGRRIVFLPQAFGPFADESIRNMVGEILPLASVVYAREETSRRFLRDAFPDLQDVKTAPDFTCLCVPETASVTFPERTYAVIIPNARMADKTSPETSSAYLGFLFAVCRAIDETGTSIVLLNHEGRGDESFLWSINDRFGNRFPVLSGLSGMDCKHIIGHSKLVVSSRFHGVVSGLTQGVPTFCTSWSHKYDELLKEHGRPGNALSVTDIPGSVAKILDSISHPDLYASAPGCNEHIRQKVIEMWTDILDSPRAPVPSAQSPDSTN